MKNLLLNSALYFINLTLTVVLVVFVAISIGRVINF